MRAVTLTKSGNGVEISDVSIKCDTVTTRF